MQFFALSLMMPVIFAISEYEISNFFLQYNLIVDNHTSGELFVVMYLYVFQINYKSGVPLQT